MTDKPLRTVQEVAAEMADSGEGHEGASSVGIEPILRDYVRCIIDAACLATCGHCRIRDPALRVGPSGTYTPRCYEIRAALAGLGLDL